MKENVFMISDASFKPDRTAILAVKDMYTMKTKQKALSIKIQSSLRAEELALRFSIELAMNAGYRHVIFVYDCLAIDTDKFKKRYEKYFETMQFLWLHRKHISEIDKITKTKEDERLIAIRDIPEEKRDEIVIDILSKYVLTEKEAKVFQMLTGKEYKFEDKKRTSLFTILYHLSSKTGKKKVKRAFKDSLTPIELKKSFSSKHSKEYEGLLKQIGVRDEFIFDVLRLRRNDYK